MGVILKDTNSNAEKIMQRWRKYLNRTLPEKSEARDRRGFISPSGVGSTDQQWMLEQVRGTVEIKQDKHGKDLVFLENASRIHEMMQAHWGPDGADILIEDSIEQWVEHPTLKLGGSIDGEVKPTIMTGTLFDFKTITTYMFGKTYDEAYEIANHYRYQACCYLMTKEAMTGNPYRTMMFGYVNRDNMDLNVVEYKRKDEDVKYVLDWINPILKHLKDGTDFPWANQSEELL